MSNAQLMHMEAISGDYYIDDYSPQNQVDEDWVDEELARYTAPEHMLHLFADQAWDISRAALTRLNLLSLEACGVEQHVVKDSVSSHSGAGEWDLVSDDSALSSFVSVSDSTSLV